MKFSTMTAVLAAALCIAGCRYDKAGKGKGAGDNASAQDISAQDSSFNDAQSGSIAIRWLRIIARRLFSSRTAEKVVGWSAQPAGVTFKLDSESAKLFAMRVRDDGLYVIGKGGMAILMR